MLQAISMPIKRDSSMVPPKKWAQMPEPLRRCKKKINTFVHLVPFTIAHQKLG
jgi:hypothetical protein